MITLSLTVYIWNVGIVKHDDTTGQHDRTLSLDGGLKIQEGFTIVLSIHHGISIPECHILD
jgi:hypothetical protein